MANKILTTVEEVAALSEGTVVQDAQGDVCLAYYGPDEAEYRWETFGETDRYQNSWLSLPATVLYDPEYTENRICTHCKTPIYKSRGRWYHKSDDNLFCMTPLQATPEES